MPACGTAEREHARIVIAAFGDESLAPVLSKTPFGVTNPIFVRP
jgi:hypothetical protein